MPISGFCALFGPVCKVLLLNFFGVYYRDSVEWKYYVFRNLQIVSIWHFDAIKMEISGPSELFRNARLADRFENFLEEFRFQLRWGHPNPLRPSQNLRPLLAPVPRKGGPFRSCLPSDPAFRSGSGPPPDPAPEPLSDRSSRHLSGAARLRSRPRSAR